MLHICLHVRPQDRPELVCWRSSRADGVSTSDRLLCRLGVLLGRDHSFAEDRSSERAVSHSWPMLMPS